MAAPPARSTRTTLRLGGPPRAFIEATREDEVVDALRADPTAVLLGGGSNVVCADEGLDRAVVRVATRGISLREAGDLVEVRAAAGEVWDDLVALAVGRGLAGVECLSGIPGLVGAVPIQNVGAYGQEVSDTLVEVRAYDRAEDAIVRLPASACAFGYRSSLFRHAERYAVLEVTLGLRARGAVAGPRYAELRAALGVPDERPVPLGELRDTVIRLRRGKGMVLSPDDPDSVSAGSFFTNPELDGEGLARARAAVLTRCGPGVTLPTFPAAGGRTKVSAAWLIERAGFGRGFGDGRVGVSSKHSLALVNRGGGSTRELLGLARRIREGVRDAFGVELAPEPVLLGCAL